MWNFPRPQCPHYTHGQTVLFHTPASKHLNLDLRSGDLNSIGLCLLQWLHQNYWIISKNDVNDPGIANGCSAMTSLQHCLVFNPYKCWKAMGRGHSPASLMYSWESWTSLTPTLHSTLSPRVQTSQQTKSSYSNPSECLTIDWIKYFLEINIGC